MAWFEPPLYRPGNKKRPSCGHPQGWNGFWHSGLWEEWRCSKCQSALTQDYRRRSLFWGLDIAAVFIWSAVDVFMNLSWPIGASIGLFILFIILCLASWWFQSTRLKSTTK